MKKAFIPYIKKIFIALLVAVVFINAAIYALFRTVSYLSAPKDPSGSLLNGEELLSLEGKNVLAVVAHPDDADWYAGGTLGMLAKRNKVTVVVGTSGEKGGSKDGLAEIREKEQQRAQQILGYDHLIFLRYPDRGLNGSKGFSGDLDRFFDQEQVDILFTFDTVREGYIYRHSDHEAAGRAALAAVKRSKRSVIVYYFHTSDPNVIVDVSSVVSEKSKALSMHVSQQSNRVSSYFRYIPAATRPRMSSGSAQEYPFIGVSAGEPFRSEVIG